VAPDSVPDPDRAVEARVGARLRAERELQGLSQVAIAERLGVTYQQIQKYETGRNRITASRLIAFAEVLDVAPSRILGESARESDVPPEVFARAQQLAHLFTAIANPRQRAALLQMAESLADGAG